MDYCIRHKAVHSFPCPAQVLVRVAPPGIYGVGGAALALEAYRVGGGWLAAAVLPLGLLGAVLARLYTGRVLDLMPEPFLRWYRRQSLLAELFGTTWWWPSNTIGTIRCWAMNTFGWFGRDEALAAYFSAPGASTGGCFTPRDGEVYGEGPCAGCGFLIQRHRLADTGLSLCNGGQGGYSDLDGAWHPSEPEAAKP